MLTQIAKSMRFTMLKCIFQADLIEGTHNMQKRKPETISGKLLQSRLGSMGVEDQSESLFA
jgi:hypothetical protein